MQDHAKNYVVAHGAIILMEQEYCTFQNIASKPDFSFSMNFNKISIDSMAAAAIDAYKLHF